MQKATSTAKSLSLFLDLDGVAHTDGADVSKLFSQLPLIANVLKEFEDDIEVVISSSWRNVYKLSEIKDQYLPEIAHLIV